MNKEIILPVLAKHFLYTTFSSSRNCAISKAAKDFFNVDFASEGINGVFVNNDLYLHTAYKENDFHRHSQKAREFGYGDIIVFNLKLTKIEPNI